MNYCGIMLDMKKLAGSENDRAHKQTLWHESEELLFHVSLNSVQMDQVLLGWKTEHVQGKKEVEPLIVQTDLFPHSCAYEERQFGEIYSSTAATQVQILTSVVFFPTGKKTLQSSENLI